MVTQKDKFRLGEAVSFGNDRKTVDGHIQNGNFFIRNYKEWVLAGDGLTADVPNDIQTREIAARDVETLHDVEIQAIVALVHFPEVVLGGGADGIKSTWLSEYGGLLETEVRAEWNQVNPKFVGFAYPFIPIDNRIFATAALTPTGYDFNLASKTAGPVEGPASKTSQSRKCYQSCSIPSISIMHSEG